MARKVTLQNALNAAGGLGLSLSSAGILSMAFDSVIAYTKSEVVLAQCERIEVLQVEPLLDHQSSLWQGEVGILHQGFRSDHPFLLV